MIFVSGEGVDAGLHTCAVEADVPGANHIDLRAVWNDLAEGRCVVAANFFTEQRCYLVLGWDEGARRRRPSRASLELFQRVLLDGGQKMVAYDAGVTASTVAMRAKHCLEFMGIARPPSKVPPLLVMAAYAAKTPGAFLRARAPDVAWAGKPYRVISVVRPDAALAGLLSAAEYRVTRLFVEGHSYAEIAARRGTSVRTVANQIAAAFHRLGISGRAELLQRLSMLQSAANEQRRTDSGDIECA